LKHIAQHIPLNKLKPEFRSKTALQAALKGIVQSYTTTTSTPTVSYGKVLLLLPMMDPKLKQIRVLRSDENETTVLIASWWERLMDMAHHPESWNCLHLCGNGFHTFRCDNWRHMWAGTLRLNRRHTEIHAELKAYKKVARGKPKGNVGFTVARDILKAYRTLKLKVPLWN
jgi:hypothetical protein